MLETTPNSCEKQQFRRKIYIYFFTIQKKWQNLNMTKRRQMGKPICVEWRVCTKKYAIMYYSSLHTSTLEARKTQVGAISTGSILFREYLQTNTHTHICIIMKPTSKIKLAFVKLTIIINMPSNCISICLPGIKAFKVHRCCSDNLLP